MRLCGWTCAGWGLLWGQVYPQDGVPGPAIGFLQEATRWWDHWIRCRATGVFDAPKLRADINDPVAPDPTRAAQPGRWVGIGWPPSAAMTELHLTGDGSLGTSAAAPAL